MSKITIEEVKELNKQINNGDWKAVRDYSKESEFGADDPIYHGVNFSDCGGFSIKGIHNASGICKFIAESPKIADLCEEQEIEINRLREELAACKYAEYKRILLVNNLKQQIEDLNIENDKLRNIDTSKEFIPLSIIGERGLEIDVSNRKKIQNIITKTTKEN